MFNRSQHSISFGSPNIVPIFCGALQHITWDAYPHEFEDFATGLTPSSFTVFTSLFDIQYKQLKLLGQLLLFN